MIRLWKRNTAPRRLLLSIVDVAVDCTRRTLQGFVQRFRWTQLVEARFGFTVSELSCFLRS